MKQIERESKLSQSRLKLQKVGVKEYSPSTQ